MAYVTEADVEQAAIDQLLALGYDYKGQIDADPDGKAPERASYSDTILIDRLRGAIVRLNPDVPLDACDSAAKQITADAL